ncbi:MAG: hypothetical protein PHQ64_03680 [Bacilli bacterium]|nr:hypothetical protein [Bacilli bacterium]
MNNLIIEKVWQDEVEPFGEYIFIAESELAKVKTTFYVSDDDMIKLGELLEKFASNKTKEIYWENRYSQHSSDIIEFYIKGFYGDSLGHICFEIFSKIQDGKYCNDKPIKKRRKLFTKNDEVNPTKHQTCFYVENIESQSLIEFSNKIKNIKLNEKIKIID